MKVKLTIFGTDSDGNKVELSFDAECTAPVLCTYDGQFMLASLSGMRVDCMPELDRNFKIKGE